MYKKILVPLDGSINAERILDHVENVAKHYNAKIWLLNVVDPPLMLGHDEVIDELNYKKERQTQKKEVESYLSHICEELEKNGIQTQVLVVSGPVVQSILKVTKEKKIDLIALTTHGLEFSYQKLFGSVAIGLMENSNIPQLLLRDT